MVHALDRHRQEVRRLAEVVRRLEDVAAAAKAYRVMQSAPGPVAMAEIVLAGDVLDAALAALDLGSDK